MSNLNPCRPGLYLPVEFLKAYLFNADQNVLIRIYSVRVQTVFCFAVSLYWYRSFRSHCVVISLKWHSLCLNAFWWFRRCCRLEAQGSMLHNLFSCFKAFNTHGTGPKIFGLKKKENTNTKTVWYMRCRSEDVFDHSIVLCDTNSTSMKNKIKGTVFFTPPTNVPIRTFIIPR